MGGEHDVRGDITVSNKTGTPGMPQASSFGSLLYYSYYICCCDSSLPAYFQSFVVFARISTCCLNLLMMLQSDY